MTDCPESEKGKRIPYLDSVTFYTWDISRFLWLCLFNQLWGNCLKYCRHFLFFSTFRILFYIKKIYFQQLDIKNSLLSALDWVWLSVSLVGSVHCTQCRWTQIIMGLLCFQNQLLLITIELSCHLLFRSSVSFPVPDNTLRNWKKRNHWHNCDLPFYNNLTLGPNTRIIVVVVLSWVLIKARKYFTSGPQFGRIRTLWVTIIDTIAIFPPPQRHRKCLAPVKPAYSISTHWMMAMMQLTAAML